ncbi:MAG: hypothetical protein KID04_14555 [Clostridium sp.]|nr:hypothetical protein [Clostridium sp.]
MYNVTFPDGRQFTGMYLSILFKDGVAQTDSAYLAERFKRKGLVVEALVPEPPKPSEEEKAEATAEKAQKKAAAAAKKAAAQSAGEPDAKDSD